MQSATGVFLAVGSGLMLGNSMLPRKYFRQWHWENGWIVFSVVALVLMPWLLALSRVHDLLGVYSRVEVSNYILPVFFGIGWGVAQVLFGCAIEKIGMALTFAVTLGLSAALGSVVPVLLERAEFFATRNGLTLLLGSLLMLGGVAMCGWAGWRREREKDARGQYMPSNQLRGLLMAGMAGVLAPMLNYGLAFGDRFITEAIRQHNAVYDAPYAIWPIVLAGGAIPNIAYAGYLAFSNRSWYRLSFAWPDVALASLMGLLWMGAVATYGMAAGLLGTFGASVGWGLFQISIILTANFSGLICGEWRGVSFRSQGLLCGGLILLTVSTLTTAYCAVSRVS